MSPILDVVAPRLLAPAIMLALALIVRGYADVGEGFSAGVIVALAVGIRYVVLGRTWADRTLGVARRANVLAVCGLLIALAFAFGGTLFGGPPFTHLPLPGEPVITIGTLELTTALGFDIGLFLLVLGTMVALIRDLIGLIPEGHPGAEGQKHTDGAPWVADQ